MVFTQNDVYHWLNLLELETGWRYTSPGSKHHIITVKRGNIARSIWELAP